MGKEIKVPAMGESITEGTIAAWHVKEGEPVHHGDILVEIETDKITMEVPAPADGTIVKIHKKQGENAQIGEVLADFEPGAVPQKAAAPPPSHPEQGAQEEHTSVLPPASRRLVEEHHLNPETIHGSGKHGQVMKGDIIEQLAHETTKEKAAPPPPSFAQPAVPSTIADRSERVVPMTRLRQRIAERLVEAQQGAAILTTFNEVDMSAIIDLRSRHKDRFKEKYGISLGFMSFFVKAAVDALIEFPEVNAEIRENEIVYKNYQDIGVAVGGPKGLLVPVVRNADRLSFAQIESEIARLAKKVNDGSVSLDDLEGGTFTISNGGIYGSMMSTPILNPPQSGILGMHNIVKRPVVVDDEIVIRPVMYLALSYDHRIVDGKEAVSFLVRIKQCIEEPTRLLLSI